MTTPQPPDQPTAPSPPHPPEPTPQQRYARLVHNLSLSALLLCPALALLPPRKLDLYTFALGGAWLVSANHLTAERSGRSILQHVSGVGARVGGAELPTERAREVQRAARERRERAGLESGERDQRGVLRRVWMGDETEGWRERRLREERKAIEEGRGYGGLIADQIWEVWNQGKKDRDEKEAEDERGGGKEGEQERGKKG